MHTLSAAQLPTLATAIRNGERNALASALNLLDDHRPEAVQLANTLLDALGADATLGSASRLIGMTGPPGVGKSSLSAALIATWRDRNLTVGVIAVDPSSPISGGALLGDRLRMKTRVDDDGVFVRSLSNRGEFGGLSAQVWPMALVMLAAFDVVLIETVGVGQREADIAQLCDTTCFVAQPGSGDSVQFIKAGILEVPHIVIVNKSDMGAVAQRTLSELQGALQREHPQGDWEIPIIATSATEHQGIEALADLIEQRHARLSAASERLGARRQYQAHWTLKRLEHDYGRSGMARLGGEQALIPTLTQSKETVLTQLAQLKEQLERG